jgi:uncharacterized spore protein YtfJ
MGGTEGVEVDRMLEGARDAMTVHRVFGDLVERDGVAVVPVARIRGGGGGGGGSGPAAEGGTGSGGGFGVAARPAGVFVIKDGSVEWRPAVDPERLALAAMALGALLVLALRSVLRSWARRAG